LRRIHVYISFHLICVCVCIRGGVENTYISTTGTLLQYSLK
jgi:hypothetical protein